MMKIRPEKSWVFFVTISIFALCSSLYAQDSESGDQAAEDYWLRGYLVYKDGEKRELEGRDLEALSKFREAQRMFDFIHRQYPTWKADIIDYRRKALATKIDQVKIRMAEGNTEPEPEKGSSQTPRPRDVSTPPSIVAIRPNGDVGTSMELSEPTPERAPNPPTERSGSPPPASSKPRMTNLNQEFSNIQAELDRLTGENERLKRGIGQRNVQMQTLQKQFAQAQEIERQLQEKLANALNELESARGQKGSRVEQLEAQLKLATSQLRDANTKSSQILSELERVKKELAVADTDQDEVQKERQAQQEKINNLLAQLDQKEEALKKARQERDAAKADAIAEASQEMEDQLAQAEADVERLSKSLETTRSELLALRTQALRDRNQMMGQLENVTAEKNDLARKLEREIEKSGELSQENQELLGELKKSREAMAALNQEMLALAGERDRLQQDNHLLERKLANVTEERDQLRKDLDEMAILLNASEHIDGDIKDMFAASRKWQEQLSEAKAEIEKLSAKEGDYKTELSDLHRRLKTVQSERSQLLADNEKYQSTVEDLNAKMADLLGQLDSNTKALEVSEMRADRLDEERSLTAQQLETAKTQVIELASANEENEFLRDLIRRQLVTQARLKHARDLVFQELQNVDVESESLLASLDELAAEPLELSSQDKAQFRNPGDKELIAELENMSFEDSKELPPVPEAPEPKPAQPAQNPASTASKQEKDVYVLAKAANYDFTQGNIKAAEAGYQEILKLDQKNIYALCNMGIIRIRQGRYDEAASLLSKSLTEDSRYAPAHYYMGVVHYKKRELEPALESFGQCVKFDVNNANAHNYIGLIASEKGWGDRAETEFRAAVTLNPNHADAHFNLAVLYATRDKPSLELAREFYQRALESGAERDDAIEQIIGG